METSLVLDQKIGIGSRLLRWETRRFRVVWSSKRKCIKVKLEVALAIFISERLTASKIFSRLLDDEHLLTLAYSTLIHETSKAREK